MLSGNNPNSNTNSTRACRQLTAEYPSFLGLPSARLLDCQTGQTALWVCLLGFSYPRSRTELCAWIRILLFPHHGSLSFTLLRSISPIFSDMSQELRTTSTSSNLENQLADAMTVIQTLMANIGNLTQQVIHLTQNMALMQANQNLPPPAPISQLSLPTISLSHLHPNTNLYHHHLCSHWPRTMQHLCPLLPTSENQRSRLSSPFLEKGTTLNLSSMDAAYI